MEPRLARMSGIPLALSISFKISLLLYSMIDTF